MLPFLKSNKNNAGISMEYRKPDESKQAPSDEMSGLEAAAEDLAKGIQSNDKKLIVAALRAAFMILESMPHEEAEHSDSE